MLRPRKHLALLAFGLFVGFWLISWFGLLGELEIAIGAQPVRVQLTGLENPQRLAVTYVTTVGDTDNDQQQFGMVIPHEELMFPSADRSTWRIAGNWIQTIHITAPASVLNRLAMVEITIGNGAFRQYRNLAEWKPVPALLTGVLPDRTEPAITLELPTAAGQGAGLPAINAPPLGTMVRQLFTFPLIALLAAVISAWLLLKIPYADASYGTAPVQSRLWIPAGACLSAAGLASLYGRYSYPFTQDDNFSQFLPMVLYNSHALLTGHWPAWNPHQFLGAPVATMGIYSVTYPPLYLAYGLARLAGHEFWTIEIYTLLHLAAGYGLLTALLRRMNVRQSLAALAGASFVLSGWFLIAARSQMTFAPLAVWPVALAWSLQQFAERRRPSWRWTILTALSIGFFFHAGHSQMWVYGMLFYAAGLGVYGVAGRLNWRNVAQAIPAMVVGLGIAAPLLILQAIEGTSSARGGAYGDRIEFLHMLLPLGSLLPRPAGLGSGGYQYFCEMYYSGTLLQALSFLALLLGVTRFAVRRSTMREFRAWLGDHAWVALFGVAVLFGLGSKGLLWTAFAQLPIFDRFRWPIKFAYFCLLYSTIGGAILAERWFTRRPRLQYPVLAAVAALLLFHVHLSRTSWYDFADRPYPQTPPLMAAAVHQPDGRLLTRWGSMDRSPLPGYYNTLPLDFATQAGAYAIGGYDTFVEGALPARRVRYKFWNDPVAAARAYGVKWVAADRTLTHPEASANPVFSLMDTASIGNIRAIQAVQDAGTLAGAGEGVTLHRLEGADPLAFVEGDPKRPLGYEMTPEGMVVDTAGAHAGEMIVCNIVMRPWLKAAVPLGADEWGRVRFRVGAPGDRVAVLYRPPWGATLVAGALLIAGGLAGAAFGLRSRGQG